jgi:glutathione S-transferase
MFELYHHGSSACANRKLKREWVRHGIDARAAADKIRRCDAYLRKMGHALGQSSGLVADRFSMADVAMSCHPSWPAQSSGPLGLQRKAGKHTIGEGCVVFRFCNTILMRGIGRSH